MKILIKTAVDLEHTKEVAKEVVKLYKDLNFDVSYKIEPINLDLSHDILYTTESAWSFLFLKKTKSIHKGIIMALHKPEYEVTCLIVDSTKGKQDKDLRGQYQRHDNIGLIEVYSDKKFIKKSQRGGKTYYDNSTRKTDLKHDTFVLFHEIAHHLEQSVGLDGLHKAELGDVQKIYIETCLALLKKKPEKLTNRVERDIKIFLKLAEIAGIPCRVTEGFRSFERQNELYAQGRTTKGNIVTNAKGGESFHCFGVAFDIVPLKGYNISNSEWEKLGKIGEVMGYDWGGRWKGFVDKPHFELTLGYKLKDFQNGNIDWSRFK